MWTAVTEHPVTWPQILLAAGAIASVAIWAYGAGFWHGSYFVSRSSFDELEKRVTVIERAKQ